MSDKKVVPIEERIPTLQEQRRKRSNRRFVIYLSIFLILIGLVIYFQSPLSNIRAVEVEGNQIAEKNVIIETSGIVTGENIWAIDRESSEAEIEELEEVQEASISRSLPGRVVIDITEQERVGYVMSEGTFIPVLTTGAVLRDKPSEQIPSDAPLLHGFSDEEKLERFSKEMSKAGDGIRNSISEVIFSPTEEDPNELKLYMNDGIEVESTIPGFAEHMASYPSVSAEVDPSVPGVLHMKLTPYFESEEEAEEESGTEEEESPAEEGGNEGAPEEAAAEEAGEAAESSEEEVPAEDSVEIEEEAPAEETEESAEENGDISETAPENEESTPVNEE